MLAIIESTPKPGNLKTGIRGVQEGAQVHATIGRRASMVIRTFPVDYLKELKRCRAAVIKESERAVLYTSSVRFQAISSHAQSSSCVIRFGIRLHAIYGECWRSCELQ